MGDDTKSRDDPAYETMPPELRPFARPVPLQRLVAPEDEADFKASIDALRILNGGPQADPFYVDPKHDPALAERKAQASVKAYAPPTAVPVAEVKVREAAPAKVVIVGAQARPAQQAVRYMAEEIDTRVFREAVEAHRAAEKSEAAHGKTDGDNDVTLDQQAPSSPWATEAPEAVRGSALPSSLRPRALAEADGDAPVSTRPASEKPAGGRSKTAAAIGISILIVAVVIGVRAFRSGGTPESAMHGPTPAATMTAAAPTAQDVRAPAPPVSAEEHAPPAGSGTSSAEPEPAPSSAPAPEMSPRPRARRALDDPYDAAPSPVVTAEPTATVAPAVTVAPTAPPQPSVAPKVPKPVPTSGRILGGEE